MSQLTAVQPVTSASPESHRSRLGREAPLRVVIVGAGKMARHHANAIQRLSEGAQLVGYSDPSDVARAAMAEVAPGVASKRHYSDLLDAEFADVAHICTPPDSHVSAARAAIEAGLSVYVEKPFALKEADAKELLELARTQNVAVCAGHQLLLEPATLKLLHYLPALQEVVHVESFFSFRTVRRLPDGSAPLPAHLQLLDILPHPVYLLVRVLEEIAPTAPVEIDGLRVGPAGTIHATISAGRVTGNLVVSLEGRPVDNYLRVVGSNGALQADYVRGTLQRTIGPGVSGIDKVLNPYRQATQLAAGTTSALAGRVLRRQRSYPGLTEMFASFYEGVRRNAQGPVSANNVLATTRICEQIAMSLQPASQSLSIRSPAVGEIAVTGGTGFLGSALVRTLVAANEDVTVLARRAPPPWEQDPRVRYLKADLSEELEEELLAGVHTVIHCAAATSGGWEQHDRDSVAATTNLLRAAAAAGVKRVIHVSSLAVLSASKRGNGDISEETPIDPDVRARGPYAWGKAESERLAGKLAHELGIDLKIVRPGALVDFGQFDPPGRLGRRIGNTFVAVGSPRDTLGLADVSFAAQVIHWVCEHWLESPRVLHVLAPSLPTKRELVTQLKRTQPDLSIIWLPRLVLRPMSLGAVLVQKLLRPSKPAVNVARIFASEQYRTSNIQAIADRMRLND